MTIATLLLREESTKSLSTIVEKSQSRKPPFLEYELLLNNNHLEFILTSNSERILKSTSSDEGFESDIDSLSIVSSDDSFTSGNLPENHGKTATNEIDSANGSSSSDSDTDSKNDGEGTLTKQSQSKIVAKCPNPTKQLINACKETYDLVNCICYTDVKFPDILVFVIQNVTYVFKFSNLNILQNFYTNFTALKAVTSQRVLNKNLTAKFNLLQRTDNNGITHIEITREPDSGIFPKDEGPSSIISINTPDNPEEKFERTKVYSRDVDDKLRIVNSRQRTESKIIELNQRDLHKSSSTDDILNSNKIKLVKALGEDPNGTLRKIWNSAEDLLDSPSRPERRKKVKGKAPPPPAPLINNENKSIYSGQFVRVNVNFDVLKDDKNRLIIKSTCNEPHPKKLQNFKLLTPKTNLTGFLKSKATPVETKKPETSTLTRNRMVADSTWTNSVPRILKKPRSKSETRQFTPMAYRYIDTTQNYPMAYTTMGRPQNYQLFSQTPVTIGSGFSSIGRGSSTLNMKDRLFGLSPKLRDFSGQEKHEDKWSTNDQNANSNLKSVIKKEDNKKKNEKKVTFSAYTTVQVV